MFADSTMQAVMDLWRAVEKSGWAPLVDMLWQSTLLAAAVALICRIWTGASPTLRYWLWQLVAAKILLAPVWTLTLEIPVPLVMPKLSSSAVEGAPSASAATDRALQARQVLDMTPNPPRLGPRPMRTVVDGAPTRTPDVVTMSGQAAPFHGSAAIVAAWLGVVLWQLARLAWQARCLALLLNRGSQPTDCQLPLTISRLSREIGLRRPPRLVLIDAPLSPFVCGVLSPTLVLSRDQLTTLSDDQLVQVLLHELGHLRRHDLLWGWLPELARITFFFHPIAHWACFQTRLERELACDALAIEHAKVAPPIYARTLLQVVDLTSLKHVRDTRLAGV